MNPWIVAELAILHFAVLLAFIYAHHRKQRGYAGFLAFVLASLDIMIVQTGHYEWRLVLAVAWAIVAAWEYSLN